MRTFTLFAAALLLAACTQGEDDPCQSDRDCDDGLVCTIEEDDRGFCQNPKDVEEKPNDQDAGEPKLRPDDAAIDGGDGGASDASTDPDVDAG